MNHLWWLALAPVVGVISLAIFILRVYRRTDADRVNDQWDQDHHRDANGWREHRR